MKNFKTTKQRMLFLMLTLITSSMQAQQTARDIVNDFIQDWVGPIFFLFIVGGIIHGIISNASLIVDKGEEGTRFKGFVNVGKIVVFYTLAFAVLTLLVVAANAAINSIEID